MDYQDTCDFALEGGVLAARAREITQKHPGGFGVTTNAWKRG